MASSRPPSTMAGRSQMQPTTALGQVELQVLELPARALGLASTPCALASDIVARIVARSRWRGRRKATHKARGSNPLVSHQENTAWVGALATGSCR